MAAIGSALPAAGTNCLTAVQRGTGRHGAATLSSWAPRQRRRGGNRRSLLAVASLADPSLVTLPVFPLNCVLHPTQQGQLLVYEPRYLAMFRAMLKEAPAGRGARFVHVLAPGAAPPALLETAVGGLPRIACCAEVETVQERADGTLAVTYIGARRVQLLLVQQEQQPYAVAAAEWYDDGAAAELDPTVDVLEREAASLLQQIERLSAVVDPGASLPDALRQYAPPAVQRRTSYDALKAAGHAAAGHIEMWRRHGSVYNTAPRRGATPDPYEAVREALGKHRRQELFSFAAAQLLVMGTPERAALLLSQDTGARLNFLLAALHPYLLELQAKASLKRGLQ